MNNNDKVEENFIYIIKTNNEIINIKNNQQISLENVNKEQIEENSKENNRIICRYISDN